MKRKMFSVKEFIEGNYKKVFSYLKESQKYIYGVIILFFVFFLFGMFIPLPEEFSTKLLDYLRELVLQTEGFGFFEMFSFIFSNNSLVGFFGIIFGIIFGIFPVFSTMSNGFVLGYVSGMSVFSLGIGSLWRLLPHGIFELPAIFISFGLGTRLGSFSFKKDFSKNIKRNFVESMRVFLFLILPLLFIAGVIESFFIVFF